MNELDVDAYERMQRQAADPLGVQLEVIIRLHANGAMSVQGPFGEPKFFLELLDEAKAVVKRQTLPANDQLIVPPDYVGAKAKEAYQCPS